MTERLRGSELLKYRYTERDLESLLDATAIDGVELVEFFPLGIPDPDGGWGTWHVGRDRLGDLIAALLGLERIPHLKVFPKGIPVPDVFEVAFKAGSQQVR